MLHLKSKLWMNNVKLGVFKRVQTCSACLATKRRRSMQLLGPGSSNSCEMLDELTGLGDKDTCSWIHDVVPCNCGTMIMIHTAERMTSGVDHIACSITWR